jgi:hypothetical protein
LLAERCDGEQKVNYFNNIAKTMLQPTLLSLFDVYLYTFSVFLLRCVELSETLSMIVFVGDKVTS